MDYVLTRDRVRHALQDAVLGLLFILCLPFLAVLAFVLRPLLTVALGICALVGIGMYATSSRFREWFEARTERLIRYRGLTFDAHVVLDDHHCWARIEDHVTIGLDDLAQAMIGPIQEVRLPAIGQHVTTGEDLIHLQRGPRRLTIRAPFSGVIRAVNEELSRNPGLINIAPYGRGWIVRLEPDRMSDIKQSMLRGVSARTRFRRDTDDVLTAIQPARADLEGTQLAPMEICDLIDGGTWNRLSEQVLHLNDSHT